MYYIYHITGIKIGCAEEPAKRVARQGYTDYSILEEHSCIYEVSKRERELQRKWGYPVDKKPYWQVVRMSSAGGKAGGKIAGKIGGKIGGNIAVESGQLASIRTHESCSKGGKVVTAMRVQCPYCDMISNPGAIGKHKKTCKNKQTP